MVAASEVITGVVAQNLMAQKRKLYAYDMVGRAVVALSLLFFAVALGFCVYALFLWLVAQYPYYLAAFYAGLTSFLMALVIGGAAWAGFRYRNQRIRKAQNDIIEQFQEIMKVLDDEFGAPIREHPKVSVLVAAISGFLLQDLSR